MFEIIPSPGTENKDWSDIEKKIDLVRPFVKTIHIDVVDGVYAPNTTFADPSPFAKITKEFVCEVHLMTDEPINHLKKWADVGFQRFIGQIERMSDQVEFVAQAQLLGDVVLALDKQSSVDDLHVPLDDLDGLLVMTIQAGFSGQKFEEVLLEKVKKLREQTALPIEVDGGINDQSILTAAKAGANRFVATSFLFNTDTPEKQFKLLQDKLWAVDLPKP
jgi:ribulose-phosphate 3-epimerase